GGVRGGAGGAGADGNITGAVHRRAAHPAVARVGRVRALLVGRRRSAGAADLVPADTAAARGRGDAVVHDESFVVAEVAIGEPVHDPVGQRVELLRRAGLRHARAAVAELGVAGDWDRDRTGEGRVRGV